jgi:glycosyltransferase involved in cell wall biosynthesis
VQQAHKVFAPSKIISKKASLEYSRKIYTLISPLSTIDKNILNIKKKKFKKKYLLYIGTLNRVKGTDLLANAFLKVFKKYKNISLIISGRNDNLERNKKSIDYVFKKCKKFKSRIKYLSVLPKKEIFNLYSQAEAIIIPSRLDNYPNVMIESILFKKPIIGFLNSSLDEVINDGKTGFLGDKQNSEFLYKKIDEFLSLSNSKKKILDKNILNLNKKLKSINYLKHLINFYNQN